MPDYALPHKLTTTLALRYVGIREVPGTGFNPFIVAWLQDAWKGAASDDEIPWCGAFVYHVAHRLLGLEAPMIPVRAREWAVVGEHRDWLTIATGDVVVLTRTGGGHVGFYTGERRDGLIELVSGNTANAVTVAMFPLSSVIAIRRLRPAPAQP